MGDDDDRVVRLELGDEVLDGERGDGVQGGAGLVHEQDGGLDRDGAGDAQALLLAAGQPQPRPVEAVLDLVPQVGPAQGGLHQVVGVGLLDAAVVEAHAGQDVLGDGHRGERVGPLEDHADGAAHLDGVDAGFVEVDAVDNDLALDAGAGDGLVHAVEGAQEGGLPAAGGADEGGDGLGLDDDVDVLHGQEVAVVDVLADDVDALGHVGSFT